MPKFEENGHRRPRGRGGNARGGSRRSYDITCSKCGAPDTVPFRPKPGRTVLCRSCHDADGGRPSNPRSSRPSYDVQCTRCGAETTVPFKPKPGRDVLCRPCMNQRSGDSKADGYEVACSHCGARDRVPFEPFPGSAVLCRDCLDNPNIQRVGGRVLHSIICSTCGTVDKVPFKPDTGSRVLCRSCHVAEKEARQKARERHASRHANSEHATKVRIDIRCDRCGADDTLPFVPRTSGPILCRQCAEATFGDDWAKRHRVGQSREFPFTCARCSRTDFVPFRPQPGRELLCRRCLDDQAIPNPERLDGREAVSPYLFIKRKDRDK